MAKYDVTHSCGHEVTHQLYGKTKGFGGRESRLEWLETQPCLECRDKERAEQRAAESASAAEANQSAGLVALSGSEKQIAWAESIRRPVIEHLRSVDGDPSIIDERLSETARGEIRDAIALLVAEVVEQAEAKWWIDNREGIAVVQFGRTLKIEDRGSALRYLVHAMRARPGLTPTAAAEAAAYRESRKPQA